MFNIPTHSLYMFHAAGCGTREEGENKNVPKTQLTSGLSYLEFIELSTLWLQS